MIRISLLDSAGNELAFTEDPEETSLCAEREYEPGDHYRISGAEHLWVRMDMSLPDGEVYAPKEVMEWTVPVGEHRLAYSPAAFTGSRHVVTARRMSEEEAKRVRVISRNPSDLRGDTDFFPHATANVETRNESCFAARNVIDGMLTNRGHGEWPWQSWGIGIREDAALTIDFGREIVTDRAAFVLRADFPHDAWWKRATLLLSDGAEIECNLEKTEQRQYVSLQGEHVITSLTLTNLIKADDPSPFPSLIQLEVLGREAGK